MPTAFAVPPPAAYQGEQPTQAALQERRESLRAQQRDALTRADTLARSQQSLSQELSRDLSALQEQGAHLQELDARDRETGLLAALRRGLEGRQRTLARRSAAAGLLDKYEAVVRQLGRASAFTDEVQLSALELQSWLDALDADLLQAERNTEKATARLATLERTRREVREAEEPLSGREGLLDKLGFELRCERANEELFRAQALLLRGERDPARALRDTMLDLHQEMAAFVQTARATADTAGHRIQALGLAADAPLVVEELQASLDELGTAMQATDAYLDQTRHLLTQVLPDLRSKLEARAHADGEVLADDYAETARARRVAEAERAARAAAEAEVEGWTSGEA
ncbi:MAG: hypothetical protein ABIO70_15215 [Pseudomonadota bacterium]